MLIPIRCFTCGNVVADKYGEYSNRIKAGEDPAYVMDSLNIKRYCCRRMFVSSVETIYQVIPIVAQAIENSGLKLGNDVALGIDFASSSLWDSKREYYNYSRQGLVRTTDEQINFVDDLIEKYHLIYAEDPVNEDDFESMAIITRQNKNCLVTGHDMLVATTDRVNEACKYGACSGAILKVNQAGTLYNSLDFAENCAKNNISLITSHRSGESVDSHISHIALATSSKMIKTGVVGGERVSKLNELLRLSEYDLIKGMADLSFK